MVEVALAFAADTEVRTTDAIFVERFANLFVDFIEPGSIEMSIAYI